MYTCVPARLHLGFIILCDCLFVHTEHGGWSSWGGWSDCSGTCGRSERVRTRRCDSPVPRFTGRNCDGSADEIEVCDNRVHCPGKC